MGKDRKDLIKKGVLEKGLPIAFLMAAVYACQVPGYLWKFQSFNVSAFFTALLVFVPVFAIAGYVWGQFVYRYKK